MLKGVYRVVQQDADKYGCEQEVLAAVRKAGQGKCSGNQVRYQGTYLEMVGPAEIRRTTSTLVITSHVNHHKA